MKLSDLVDYGKNRINQQDMNILISALLDINPLMINDSLNMEISKNILSKYKKYIERLENNEPIQYVIGKWNFYGYQFQVDKNVLIPRFCTEELIENSLIYIRQHFNNKVKILDLCTGSGCIGITIAKEMGNSDVTISDISNEALNIAKKNAKNLKAKVNIIRSDLLENINDKFDVIISNPPYLLLNEEIDPLVKNNEPHIALYGGEDGLFYYRKILSTVKKNLNSKYMIAFEIGDNLLNSIIDLVKSNLENVEIISKKDLTNKDRMLFILKK